MSDSSPIDNQFIAQVIATVMENLSDEKFVVSELEAKMHMSRSNLLRRIKYATHQSASQLIREIRLKRSMELLGSGDFTVSEVAHRVGFSGTSYLIKCFREYYGYPPGEAGKRREAGQPAADNGTRGQRSFGSRLLLAGALIAVIAVGIGIYLA